MSLRLTAALVAAGLLILLVTGAYWKGRIEGAAGERSKAAAARAAAAVAEVETRGERESAQRAEIVVRQRTAADRAVAELTGARQPRRLATVRPTATSQTRPIATDVSPGVTTAETNGPRALRAGRQRRDPPSSASDAW